MSTDALAQLTTWIDEALAINAQAVFLVPDEPPVFRVGSRLQRGTTDILSSEQVEDVAQAVIGRKRLKSLGRRNGSLDARVRLPDGRYASVTAARAGGRTTLLARPVRTISCDHRAINVPARVIEAVDTLHGLVVVTGPAGCGKTTTCYALLDHLNNTRPLHIVTVGYHIDYVLEPRQALIQERQIGVDAPDMLAGIQSAVLQGADVLFVGEIRDLETFQACVRVAEAGCLVITQLHQPTPQAAIDRLISLQPPETLPAFRRALANSLQAVLAQALLTTPDGRRIAAYGALIPDHAAREAVATGAALPPDCCNPVLEKEIQRLVQERMVTAESARQASDRLAS